MRVMIAHFVHTLYTLTQPGQGQTSRMQREEKQQQKSTLNALAY